MPSEKSTDLTDGLRVTFEGGEIIHLRPSGIAAGHSVVNVDKLTYAACPENVASVSDN